MTNVMVCEYGLGYKVQGQMMTWYVIFNVIADIFDGSPSNYHLLVFDLGKVSSGIHGK